MTDAASKAQEIVREWVDRTYLKPVSFGDCRTLENAIESAISAAVAEERERAGKLVDAAKAVVPAINSSESLSNRKRDAFKAALREYEVPHE